MRIFPCRCCNAPIMFLKTCKGKIKVEFSEFQKSIAQGQSVVIYDEEFVTAGGIIEEVC